MSNMVRLVMRKIFLLLFVVLAVPTTAFPQHSDGLDDLLQHAPLASVYVLKGCDFECSSSWMELALTGLSSYVLSSATTYSLKQVVAERRPDGSDRRSFPSGHATLAFAGATVLHHEYGKLSPWVTVGGYGVATLVSIDRLRLDRHYLHDVCAGAAIGVLSTELTYYLRKRLKSDRVDVAFTGHSISLALAW